MRKRYFRRKAGAPVLVLVAVALAVISVTTMGDGAGVASFGSPPARSSSVSASSVLHASPKPVALPPVHVHPLGMATPDAVNPIGIYSSEPAPMGIGDFGVGAGGNAYTYNTSEFLGNFSWQTMDLVESGNYWFTDQLNVVLQFVQSGVTYAYWIQDVAFMNSSSNELTFENNIWNFTSLCLSSTAVVGNGSVYPYSGCQQYYAEGASVQPGADRIMPSPGDFGLLVRSYENGAGEPEVAFEYWDGVTSYYVTYDNVYWPWATGLSADNNFVVDGFTYNPLGLFYDAELTIGGPGGGAATAAAPVTDISSRLLYWNGHNFEAPPSVWNFGSNTAEAVSNVQSVFSNDRAGLPLTVQLNGTTRNATPAQAYNQHRVGELAVSAPSISQGTVAIPGDTWSFVGGSATFTLVPGTYHVWVNSTSGNNDLGICAVTAGGTTTATLASGCTPVVSTPTASPGGADVGQSVTFQSTLLAPGSGGDTYVWHTSPTGLGCSSSTSLTLVCAPSTAGAYSINVTVTDSSSRSYTSPTLSFTVDPDPSVETPSPNRSSVETGASVTFTAAPSGGAHPYSYQWSGLPSPCTGTSSASPSCTPATAGVYSIAVTVTDGNGFSVTSPTLDYDVSPGPSVASPTATPAHSVDLGQPVTFTTTALGGSGGYTYSWSGLPAGCSSVSAAMINCTPTTTGSSSIDVRVVDSSGGAATSGNLSFTVDTDPSIGSLAVSPASVDLGQTLHFSSKGATGGTGTYRYVWSSLPAGCVSENTTTLTCVPTGPGTGTAKLTVYDANNGSSNSTTPYEIYPDPSFAGVSETRGGADLGQSVTFSASPITGGTGSFTYRWTGLPAGCVSSDNASIVCAPTVAGSFSVTLNVTDSNGLSVQHSVGFTAYEDPTTDVPSATPGSVESGETVTFSVNASGGDGLFTYSWEGLPSGCLSVNAPTVTCQPSASGTTDITVTVTDSNGMSVVSGTLSFTVTSAPATFLGLPALEGYAVLAVLVGALAVATGFVVVRRRRRRNNPPS